MSSSPFRSGRTLGCSRRNPTHQTGFGSIVSQDDRHPNRDVPARRQRRGGRARRHPHDREPRPPGRDGRRGAARRRGHLPRRLPAGEDGATGMGRGPGAGPRPGDPTARPAGGGERRVALAADHPRDREADPGVARRGAGGRRHLQLLPRRGPPPLRPDGPVRDAGQAALHVPRARGGRGDRHRRATSPSPSPRGTSCPPCCAGTRWSGSPPSTRPPPPRRSRS